MSNYLVYLPDLYCLLLLLIIMSQKPFILIADDDQEDRYLLHTAFEEIGRSNDIYLVENGLQVFSYLDTSLEQSGMPSLIVLDLNMPILNGMETLSRLKSHTVYKNIPVIMFTTSVHEVEKARCLEIGALDFIKKPARFQQTISTARYLHESASENRPTELKG
jgi:CheY-like chemotaxis protein